MLIVDAGIAVVVEEIAHRLTLTWEEICALIPWFVAVNASTPHLQLLVNSVRSMLLGFVLSRMNANRQCASSRSRDTESERSPPRFMTYVIWKKPLMFRE